MSAPVYKCEVLPDGTGSASACLTPMLNAWAAEKGIELFPGTLNLCADRDVQVPARFISLSDHHHLALPKERRAQPGFNPRLHPAKLQGDQPCWIYRWSGPEDLRTFVGDADGCPAERRCEVIAEVGLRATFALKKGDILSLEFT